MLCPSNLQANIAVFPPTAWDPSTAAPLACQTGAARVLATLGTEAAVSKTPWGQARAESKTPWGQAQQGTQGQGARRDRVPRARALGVTGYQAPGR